MAPFVPCAKKLDLQYRQLIGMAIPNIGGQDHNRSRLQQDVLMSPFFKTIKLHDGVRPKRDGDNVLQIRVRMGFTHWNVRLQNTVDQRVDLCLVPASTHLQSFDPKSNIFGKAKGGRRNTYIWYVFFIC